MKGICLLYDATRQAEVSEEIIPLFEQHIKISIAFENGWETLLAPGDAVVAYLSDSQLKEFIITALSHQWILGLLPHPELYHGRQRFWVAASMEDTIAHLITTKKLHKTDLLLANGQPVFDTIVIGECLSVLWGSAEPTRIKRKLGRLKHFFGFFRQIRLHQYTLEFKEKEEGEKESINTAALGMLVVLDGRSTLLSRKILAEGATNDGMLHNLILAPKSSLGLLKFGFLSFFRGRNSSKLPPFAAYIKTARLKVQSDSPIELSVDDRLMSTQALELEVKSKALHLMAPPFTEQVAKKNNHQEVFKIQTLPQGQLRDELLRAPLPFIEHATTEQFKELFDTLRENAKPSSSYLVLMLLSTFIATLGLFANSSPVIIGAMILAPLMSPIVSLSMGVLRQDHQLVRTSFTAIGLGMLLGYLCAIIITLQIPLSTANVQIMTRTSPNLLDLGIAVGSGIAGAYAHARKEIAKTLAGVAIAVALVPPLAVSGIGAGRLNWEVFSGAFLLLFTNLAGIVLAGALTFLFLGFSPFRRARKGLAISLLIVLSITAPLTSDFTRMVRETRILQRLDALELEHASLREVEVRKMSPLRLSVTLVSDEQLETEQLEQIKQAIEEELGEEVELEITLAISM
ncbi:MAG: DUF389 domain-containing protein [Bacteroidetes bacterium]|nr:DUF389 domain-containing protein [Bacteroidota bacterium]